MFYQGIRMITNHHFVTFRVFSAFSATSPIFFVMVSHDIDALFGNGYRMRRGECSQSGDDDTPRRRSARQAGLSPERPPPPPPQAPTTEQVIRMFEERRNQELMELLRGMQNIVGQNQKQGSRSKLSDFQRTRPPSFDQATDPIEADDWLRTMEKKLEIAHCDEVYKVPFATHYLEGYAAIWWDNTKAVWPAGEDITWERFKEKFRTYHIPTGVLKTKQREFLALVQGNMTVTEYLNKFNHLERYSVHDVATEERKIDRFLGGLSPTLRCQLSMLDFPDFQTLVNKALIAEREYKSVAELKGSYEDRKRKYEPKKTQSEPYTQNPRVVQPVPPLAPTNSKPAWNHGSSVNDKPAIPERMYLNPQDKTDYMRKGACFRCRKPGHFAKT